MPAHTLRAPKRQTPTETRDPDLLPVGPRTKVGKRFIYVHYESAWNFHAEHGWLPKLSKLIAVPGVNGVGEDGSLSRVINGATAKGGTVIRPEDKRLLVDGEDPEDAAFYQYGRYYSTTTGERWWIEPGSEPTVTPSGRIIWNTDESVKVYASFRKHLRDVGIVEPIHPLVIAEKVSSQQARVEDLQRRASMNPHLSSKLVEAVELLTAMQAQPDDEPTKADKKAGRKVGRARRGSVDG